MPWGENLHVAFDDDENIYTTGPPGSLLEGVDLQDPVEIAVMSTVILMTVKDVKYKSIPGLVELMDRHPGPVKAAHKIARIYQKLARSARDDDSVPEWHILIYDVLMSPNLDRRTCLRGLSAIAKSTSAKNGNGGLGADEDSDDSDSDSDDEDLGKLRPSRTANQAHAPGPKRSKLEWEFIPGTDLTPAELDNPEPGKFFMVRRNIADHSLTDVREFTQIPKFDWKDISHVTRLNKWRGQIISRGDETKANETKGGPWSVPEHDALLALVTTAKANAAPGASVDFDPIAVALKARFVGVTQPKGTPCAKTSIRSKSGVLSTPARPDAKLVRDRVGPLDRTALACKTQAMKFPAIAAILKGGTVVAPLGGSGASSSGTQLASAANTPATAVAPFSSSDSSSSGNDSASAVTTPTKSNKRGADEAFADDAEVSPSKSHKTETNATQKNDEVAADEAEVIAGDITSMPARTDGQEPDVEPEKIAETDTTTSPAKPTNNVAL